MLTERNEDFCQLRRKKSCSVRGNPDLTGTNSKLQMGSSFGTGSLAVGFRNHSFVLSLLCHAESLPLERLHVLLLPLLYTFCPLCCTPEVHPVDAICTLDCYFVPCVVFSKADFWNKNTNSWSEYFML